MRGHGLCLVLRLRERNEFAVTRWPWWLWSVARLAFLDQGVHRVHGSGITHRALQGAHETGRPLEAVGNGAEPDTLGAVLTLVVVDLARAWTKQKRKRGPTLPNGAVLQPTIRKNTWKP